MTTDNFCFYLQNRLIQTVKQEANGKVILPLLVFPDVALSQKYSLKQTESKAEAMNFFVSKSLLF